MGVDIRDRKQQKKKRKLAKYVYLYLLDNGDFEIVYHQVAIVIIHADGSYTLDSGGWRPGGGQREPWEVPYRDNTGASTKARMSKFAPCKVAQRKYKWWVAYQGESYAFVDGMKLLPDGTVFFPDEL